MPVVTRLDVPLPFAVIEAGPDHILVRGAQVADVLRFCEERSLWILGIEGFHVSPAAFVPDMRMIVDLSELVGRPRDEQVRGSLETARAFFAQVEWTEDLQFEFLFGEDLPRAA